MSPEALLWGLFPTGAALVSTTLSLACVAKRTKPLQFVCAVVVTSLTVFSLWLLKKIFIDGDWPTFLPHILIAVAAIVTVTQIRAVVRQSKNAQDQI